MPVSVHGDRLQSILCGVDFSRESRVALRYAVALARVNNASLTTMYVDDPVLTAAAAAGYDTTLLEQGATREVRQLLERVGVAAAEAHLNGIVIAVGRPAAEIVKAARRLSADLIVLGTHGRSGAAKVFFGSTTAQVLRHAPAPVLAVPATAMWPDSSWPDAPVLAAIAPGPGDREHVASAAALARRFGVGLILVHVVDAPVVPPWSRREISASDRRRLASARRRMRQLAAEASVQPQDSCVLFGSPVSEIAELAAERGVAVITMMLRAGHGILGPRQGTQTYQLLCASPTPVLAFTIAKSPARRRQEAAAHGDEAEPATVTPSAPDAAPVRATPITGGDEPPVRPVQQPL
jgi:nucleotide-binding universal stress UspA family protein